MVLTAEQRSMIDRFDRTYACGRADVMQAIERAVCGCDYGGTSWTTRQEAERSIELLRLAPGRRLLEVGTGAGWPGLYMARRTGCDAALTDLPLEGLRIAGERAAADRLDGAWWIIQADGAALPFRDGAFDAVYHSDVLCCLRDKEGVLRACRRVVREDGVMAFSVIHLPEGLSADERAHAETAGPPFAATARPYAELLDGAGWEITTRIDLTAEYLVAAGKTVAAQEERRGPLVKLWGREAAEAMLLRARERMGAIKGGLLCRELIVAAPTPSRS